MFDRVYLTGFGVFGNHQVNPTQLIAEHFQQANIPGLTCNVLEVTVQRVDNYIKEIQEEIKKHPEEKILNLHFGVGPNKVYHLETCAYNNKDFCIPDNKGVIAKNQQIVHTLELEHKLNSKVSSLPLATTFAPKYELALSTNPGRYLCNYIYFKSLHDLSLNNQKISSFFIHIPIASISPHQQNINFVGDLLSIWLKKQ